MCTFSSRTVIKSVRTYRVKAAYTVFLCLKCSFQNWPLPCISIICFNMSPQVALVCMKAFFFICIKHSTLHQRMCPAVAPVVPSPVSPLVPGAPPARVAVHYTNEDILSRDKYLPCCLNAARQWLRWRRRGYGYLHKCYILKLLKIKAVMSSVANYESFIRIDIRISIFIVFCKVT